MRLVRLHTYAAPYDNERNYMNMARYLSKPAPLFKVNISLTVRPTK